MARHTHEKLVQIMEHIQTTQFPFFFANSFLKHERLVAVTICCGRAFQIGTDIEESLPDIGVGRWHKNFEAVASSTTLRCQLEQVCW